MPDEIAIAGPDGKRAADLLAAAKEHGSELLTRLAGRAVERLLGSPRPLAAPVLLTDDELRELQAALASTIAAADLLGRVRVRERARRAADRHGVTLFADADPDGPPGPPPRPGLVWRRETQRWVREDDGTDAVPPTMRERVTAYVKKRYAALAKRYGPTGAKLVMGASLALLPVPLPGVSMLPVAVAEAVHQVRRALPFDESVAAVSVAPPDPAASAEFVRGVFADAGEEYTAFADAADGDDPFRAFAEPVPPLPPAAAVKYFRKLVPSLSGDPGRYGPLLDRHAFTLAHAADQVLLDKVKETIADRLVGADPTPGGPAVEDVLEAAGVSPSNPQYGEMVFRTNMLDAYNQGAVAEMDEPDMRAVFPAWRYDGVLDERTGDDHRPRIGRYYPADAPFHLVRGPRVYNCRCSPTPISKWDLGGVRVETSW